MSCTGRTTLSPCSARIASSIGKPVLIFELMALQRCSGHAADESAGSTNLLPASRAPLAIAFAIARICSWHIECCCARRLFIERHHTMFRLSLPLLLAASTTVAVADSRPQSNKTIVLVHGAFADGSSWDRVAPFLEAKGYRLVAVHGPL